MAETIVLKWEINNPSQTLASGRAESGTWREGGFEWSAMIDKHRDNCTNFAVFCGRNHADPWACAGEIAYHAYKADGSSRTYKSKMQLHRYACTWTLESALKWYDLINPELYNVNDKVNIEFHITIESSSGGDPQFWSKPSCEALKIDNVDLTKFLSPVETNNVTLLIGDKNLDVSKEYLAMHSPVFKTTFFGSFVENGKKEVEIKEVEYEDFVNLLLVFFPDHLSITDATVVSIAKLADRFQIKSVLRTAENHLLLSNKFTTVQKTQLADTYRFNKLRDHCLQSFKSVQAMRVFKDTPDFANVSDQMKAAISERVIELL